MSLSDTLYRAFVDFRKITNADKDCRRQREVAARAAKADDRLESVRTVCKIDEDWIAAIERGLPFIAKAIAEERQFIRSDGEVVDIQKVKTVSRESAEHLAKHGNLLTKRPENGRIVPDRLFTVERQTDYAVYENRFLYMLLCYLRDFVSYRYSKIADFTDTYSGTLRLKKEVECGNRKTVYAITVEDERKEEEFLRETSGCKDQLDRIEGILRTLEIYLASPLMEFVGKAPLLKPPITETNVLKMNKNFKAAKELYHFIASYEGDGFSVKREKICLHPFSESVAEEFAEAAELIGFLAYEHGSGQREVFSKRYADYLRELKRNEEEKERQNLKMLKKRVAETGKGAEEYMLALENKVRELETQCMEIPEMKAQTEKAVSEIERLQKERKEADEARFQSERLLAETRTEHLAETARIRADYESRLFEESRRAKEECARLAQRHAEELSVKETEYSEKLQTAEAGFEQKLSEYRENERKEKQEADKKLQGLTEENEQLQKEAESNREEAKRWEREKLLSDARMNALKREYGVFTGKEDFTSRESFNEIEKQYQAFRSFFKEEWKKTKKRIKNEILHPAAEKEKDSSAQEDKTFDQANGKESGE